jgi:hypothetical protein
MRHEAEGVSRKALGIRKIFDKVNVALVFSLDDTFFEFLTPHAYCLTP